LFSLRCVSGLAHFWPTAYQSLFDSFSGQKLNLGTFYWIGLIDCLFCAGQELKMQHGRDERKVVPFLTFGH